MSLGALPLRSTLTSCGPASSRALRGAVVVVAPKT
jgi:hypothetical protein